MHSYLQRTISYCSSLAQRSQVRSNVVGYTRSLLIFLVLHSSTFYLEKGICINMSVSIHIVAYYYISLTHPSIVMPAELLITHLSDYLLMCHSVSFTLPWHWYLQLLACIPGFAIHRRTQQESLTSTNCRDCLVCVSWSLNCWIGINRRVYVSWSFSCWSVWS